MPAQDQSGKLGSSSSPIANQVIEANKGNQACTTEVSEALAQKHTDKTVTT